MVIAMKANSASAYSTTVEGGNMVVDGEGASSAPAAASASSDATQSGFSTPWPSQAFDMAMHMLLNNEEGKVREAVGLLVKITNNIVANPMQEKYRKMKASNATFTSKLGSLPGGNNVMMALGFTLTAEEWVLTPSEQAWNNLVACQTKLQAFNSKLSAGVTGATGATPAPAPAYAATPPTADLDNNNVLLMAMMQQMAAMNSSGDTSSSNNNNSGSNGGDGNSGDGGSSSSTGDSNEKA